MINVNPSKNLIIFLGVLAMIFSLNYLAMAWTEPSQPAPGGNVPAPINVGDITQAKTGGLWIEGLLYAKGLFVANGTGALGEGLNVMAGGKVGIGTQTPNVKLDVVGKIHATGDICTDAGPSGGRCLSDGGGTSGTNYWTLSGSNLYPINTTYNVGIGTITPAYTLDVIGAANFNNNLVHGVQTPVAGTDAANKAYVDAQLLSTQGLIGYEHTRGDCTTLGGAITSISGTGFPLCKFVAAACPSGWTQYKNFSQTSPNSCQSNSYCGPSVSSCSVAAGHSWGDTPRETCYYWSNTAYGGVSFEYASCCGAPLANNACGIPFGEQIFISCGYGNLFACRQACRAIVNQIGCY